MERLIDGERRLRREYSADFKAVVMDQTREPAASVAGVASSHGLHPNMVRRWLSEQRLAREEFQPQRPAFVPHPIPSVVADDHIPHPVATAQAQASGDGQLIRI